METLKQVARPLVSDVPLDRRVSVRPLSSERSLEEEMAQVGQNLARFASETVKRRKPKEPKRRRRYP